MTPPGLDTPLARLVGGRTATALATGLDLHTAGDLLRHYPRRYAERGELTELSQLTPEEHVTVLAEVVDVTVRPMRARRGQLLEVRVGDGHATLTLTFFNQAWRARDLVPGRRGLFAGKVGVYRGRRQLAHPDYVLFGSRGAPEDAEPGDPAAADDFARALIPVYPATAALSSWRIAQAVRVVLDVLDEVPDPLPADLRERHGLVDLATAFRLVHRPEDRGEVDLGLARLRFEEAFLLQLVLARRRAAARGQPAVPRVPRPGGLLEAFDARLPFPLTRGQQEVGAALLADLAADHPMLRLLQGEVGSGKTVVALRAMLAVVDAGGQAALLAPTEVLAQQHYRSLTALLGPLAAAGQLGGAEQATRVALLTGSQGAAARRAALADVAEGVAGLVVGTHALLQDPVQFADLGLVVVDEQHRFGVEQRDALRSKAGTPPHLLVMTATPIPRTIAMTVFGDLEVSTLRELPGGRAGVASHVVPVAERPHYLDRAWQRVREEVAAGGRAYVVCPRIGGDATGGAEEEEEELLAPEGDLLAPEGDAAGGANGHRAGRAADGAAGPPLAVLDVARELAAGPLAGTPLGVLHGRLPADEKDAVMRDFVAGRVGVLVATTVVEVGVDVPQATVMVVLDAERFGVSQLHQLRGRVGRGRAPGLCLLVTGAPAGSPARDRLAAVAATSDGFALARLDLEQRREGDVLGAVQSGRRSSLRLLRVLRDEDVIRAARAEAAALVAADPELAGHPALADALAADVAAERARYLERA
ncbi:MAG: ATP-dependent DNA helicase RecG [Actinomycetota bacterium]